ncbi:MAG: hypothetical protein RMJ60_08540, partial [Anaerolineales bacterium]|nr:hypothetical protein [Anaerolineales bacterium]
MSRSLLLFFLLLALAACAPQTPNDSLHTTSPSLTQSPNPSITQSPNASITQSLTPSLPPHPPAFATAF